MSVDVRLLKTISIMAIATLCISGTLALASFSDESDGAALYAVTFDGNDGRTDMGETSVTYSVIAGQPYQLHASLFEREGYYLSGWKSGSMTYDIGNEVTIDGSMTFTAQWVAVPSGTYVEQDTNAPSSCTIGYSYTPISDYTVTSGMMDSWWIFIEAANSYGYEVENKPDWLNVTYSKGTLTFSGNADGSGVWLVKLKILSAGQPYYIWWTITVPTESDDMKTVAFDMGGGTGSVDSITGPVGSAFVLPNYTDSDGSMIEKDGQTLVGWRMYDGAGSYSIYPLGSLYTIRFDNTATAYWVDDPNVLVYSMDGGSLENVEAYVTQDGDSVTLAKNGAIKDGYTFLGWRPSQDHDVACAPGLVMTVEGSMYMEAYFVPNGTSTCTVTFDPNGGQGVISSQTVEPGMFVKLPTSLNFVKSGFTFIGWSEVENGEPIGTLDFEVSQDVTLYAVWEENGGGEPENPDVPDTFRVVFDPNGGSQSYDIQSIQEGGLVVRPYDPTRDGHVFMGWRSLTGTGTWDFGIDTVDTDMILQAQWSQHFTISVDGPTVTVTLVGDWFDKSTDIYWDDISDRGASTSIGPSVGTASHDYSDGQTSWTSYGHIVVTSKDSTGSYTSRMPYSVTGEHYNPPNEYIVTFDPSNGDDPFTQVVSVGGTATMPDAPVWQGHTFTGWYHQGTVWDFDTTVTCDMTLVASWDDEVPDNPDIPTIITPTASGRITEVEGGWKLDGTSSKNAMSWEWFLDGTSIGKGSSMTLAIDDVSEGVHKIVLKVASSSGHTDTWSDEIEAGGVGDEGKDWLSDNWHLVVCTALVLIVLMIVVVRYI